MATANNLICRIDGKLYAHRPTGKLVTWGSPVAGAKVYFGEDGDETAEVEFKHREYDPESLVTQMVTVPSGTAINSGSLNGSISTGTTALTFLRSFMGEYYGDPIWDSETVTLVPSGTRWWAFKFTDYWPWFPNDALIYWSTVGFLGPYQTDVDLFLTNANYELLDLAEDPPATIVHSRTGITIPSVAYVLPPSLGFAA